MAKCGICNDGIDYPGRGGVFKHQWDAHREEMEKRRLAGMANRHTQDVAAEAEAVMKAAEDNGTPSDQPPDNKANISKPPASKSVNKAVAVAGTRPTSNIADAVSIIISPKTFSMSSSMLWRAMEAAKRYWGWPAAMTPEDFLDTYLSYSYRQRGIVLDGFELLQTQTPDFVQDNNGNGHNGHNGNGHKEESAPVEYGQVGQEELESAISNSF